MKLGSLHFVALLLVSVSARADIRLPALFSYRMVFPGVAQPQTGLGLSHSRKDHHCVSGKSAGSSLRGG